MAWPTAAVIMMLIFAVMVVATTYISAKKD